MIKQQTIIVKNNGSTAFVDRYDGEDFEIQPGGETEMLVECATLCLGFGEESKARCLRRLGWAFTTDAQSEGMKRLDTFSFHLPGEARKRSAFPDLLTAPASNEMGEGSQDPSPKVGRPKGSTAKKLSPLAKLAQAQARAG